MFRVTKTGAICYTAAGDQNKPCSKPRVARTVHNLASPKRLRALVQVTQKDPGPEFYSTLLPESPLSASADVPATVMDAHGIGCSHLFQLLLTITPRFQGGSHALTLHSVPEFSGADSAPRSRDGHLTHARALRASEGQPWDLCSNSGAISSHLLGPERKERGLSLPENGTNMEGNRAGGQRERQQGLVMGSLNQLYLKLFFLNCPLLVAASLS